MFSLLGSTMGNESEFEAIVREFNAGRLMPVVDSIFDLQNGKDAFARMAAGDQFGKIVVRISE